MRITQTLLASTYRRLLSAVYGVSKTGVAVQPAQLDSQTTQDVHLQALELKVGEDACFVTNSTQDRQILGVADGVGGWKREGIDSSHFSAALMSSCANVVNEQRVDLDRPVDILTRAMRETVWLNSRIYGSSTACLLTLNCQTGLLNTANLGDSGFMILRDGRVVARSRDVLHHFNCPYQLSNPPPGFHLNALSDSPNRASLSTFQLEAGDVVLAATNGLFSNMYDEDIAWLLAEVKTLNLEELTRTATSLVETAFTNSNNEAYMSPFARDGSLAFSWNYVGGKQDDITVILGVVHGEEVIRQTAHA